MPDWRAVAVGVGAFVATSAVAVFTVPPYVFVTGFLGGVAALVSGGGLWSGLWHGLLAGVGELLVVLGVVALLVTAFRPAEVAPGFGLSMAFLSLLGVVALVESTVAGAFVGALTSGQTGSKR
ncbi:hypothetical protein [Halobacterium wangiae]|uniref:hypothetical protein n=1 Tax=Halobacterium wangiae TaxID=2902623 RepID=UPI001E2E24A4|nr:hypothetical protein [Halobacterium wangiae]